MWNLVATLAVFAVGGAVVGVVVGYVLGRGRGSAIWSTEKEGLVRRVRELRRENTATRDALRRSDEQRARQAATNRALATEAAARGAEADLLAKRVLDLGGAVGARATIDLRELAISEPTPINRKSSSAVAGPQPDDLTLLHGVDRVLARHLGELDVTTFAQLASLDDDGVADLDARLPAYGGRVRRAGLVDQARAISGADIAGRRTG